MAYFRSAVDTGTFEVAVRDKVVCKVLSGNAHATVTSAPEASTELSKYKEA